MNLPLRCARTKIIKEVMKVKKSKVRRTLSKLMMRTLSLILTATMLVGLTAIVCTADTYHTIRINYYYIDGSPAHDPYIATFTAGAEVDLTVTNPNVNGFEPMQLNTGETDPTQLPSNGVGMKTIDFDYASITENVTMDIYYVAGLTHYAARYYLQNIYDDLYTLDREKTDANTNRLGYTGTTPDDLESETITGFTSLFHEPDAIASDGSTVFRVYYDRNYYSVDFNLGEGGYGVDPIYAKYGTIYRVDVPKRAGYTFAGWARTSADSSSSNSPGSKGRREEDGSKSSHEWHYVDENGDPILDKSGNMIHDPETLLALDGFTPLTLSGEQTIPAENTYYQALWDKGTTFYSVVYWVEKPDSVLDEHSFDNINNMTADEVKALVTANYSVAVSHDVTGVESGTHINLSTSTTNNAGESFPISDFFGYNFNKQDGEDSLHNPIDSDGKKIDFVTMSETMREEFAPELQRYYELNTVVSSWQFRNGDIEVLGDGTSRINIFYKRKTFNLQFFYAKTTGGTLTYDENGVPHWSKGSDGVVYLTNGTKKFSKPASNTLYGQLLGGNGYDVFVRNVVDDIPAIVNHTELISPKVYDDGNGGTIRFWYYEVQAKFGSSLIGKWFNDAFETPLRNDRNGDDTQRIYFGSWAVEKGSDYLDDDNDEKDRGNYTIKGLYERLYDEILLKDSHIKNKLKADKNFDYTELHFVASWDNTGNIKGTNWNDGVKRVYNFTYKNCVELLPSEDYIAATENGISVLINGGTYPAGDHEELNENGELETVHYLSRTIEGRYTSIIEMDVGNGQIKRFGLTDLNTIETYDAGGDYGSDKSLRDASTVSKAIRKNQTAVTLNGFKAYANDSPDIKTSFTIKSMVNGECVSENYSSYGGTGYGNGNAQAKFYAANGFNQWHHADIYFFYSRNFYSIKYRNNNVLEDTARSYYNAPLFLQKFTYTPVYPVPELTAYYEFDGWYYDPFYIVPVDFANDRIPDDDITFYAKWVPRTIKVIFYDDYDKFYEDRKLQHPELRVVLGKDAEQNDITVLQVDYGTYIPLKNIPVDDDDPNNPRPKLDSITKDATFAGWYYMRDRVPQRFEPENVHVTTLNDESGGDDPVLRLYAEWVTTNVAKYSVSYVRADDPTVEIADPTTGRAYVWKTRTFKAKTGDELYDDYKWSAEGEDEGTNWWPTTNSTSMVIRANTTEHGSEPNNRSFTYIQKDKVYYKVQYLNAANFQPLDPDNPYEEKCSTHGAVKADAKIFPNYIARASSSSLVLTASTKADPEEQKEEELSENIITFLYDYNEKEYLYEVEYLVQSTTGETDFTTYLTETLTVPIAEGGAQTSVSLSSDIFTRDVVRNLLASGFSHRTDSCDYLVTDASGETDYDNPHHLADTDSVPIVATDKKTIRVFFERKSYHYIYKYIDHSAESEYLKYLELHKDDPDPTAGAPWDGVIQEIDDPANTGMTDEEVEIPAPETIAHEPRDYVRLRNTDGTLTDVRLTIQPDDNGAGYNVVKVYYRLDTERELEYKLICVNENDETDRYSDGTPQFGRMTINLQTVTEYDSISPVTFYSTNEEIVINGPDPDYLHDHKYNFLGWYTTDEYDPEHPEEGRLTTSDTLTKEMLDGMPSRDCTFYALVEQEMVKMDIMFYLVDDYDSQDFKALNDDLAGARVQAVINNEGSTADVDKVYPSGERAGQRVAFTNPTGHENHVELPWHRTAGYSLNMAPIDDRVNKYEFCEWWAISADSSLIREIRWSSSMEYAGDSIDSQLARNRDQYLIAVYTRRNVTEMPYTINYRFIPRTGSSEDDYVSYTVKGTLDGSKGELSEGVSGANLTTSGYYELTDEFIMARAPYESNYGQTLLWKDTGIVKDSKVGAPAVIDEGTQEVITPETADRIITTVTAYQDTKQVFVKYRLEPEGAYTTLSVDYGANREKDKSMEAIRVEDDATYNGKLFTYWAVRKTENGPVIAKSYAPWFELCVMDNYWISPVFETAAEDVKTATLNADRVTDGNEDWYALTWNEGEDGEWITPGSGLVFTNLKDKVKFVRMSKNASPSLSGADMLGQTAELDTADGKTYTLTGYAPQSDEILGTWSNIILTFLDYTRNRWTDEEGNLYQNGNTDLLYSDFEIAFEDGDNDIYSREGGKSSDYTAGVVIELCARWPAGYEYEQGSDYNFYSNEDHLKQAIINKPANSNSGSYYYTDSEDPSNGGKRRSIQFSNIPTDSMSVRNRVEYAKPYKNAYSVNSSGENVYTNSTYLMKFTAYLKKGSEVTLSNPVYICLTDTAGKDLAIGGGYSIVEYSNTPNNAG